MRPTFPQPTTRAGSRFARPSRCSTRTGSIGSRQGVGWFVVADPLRQTLGRLGTIEAQLAEAGIASTRKVLEFGFVNAPARVRRVLGVRRVLEVRRLTLADGRPFARVTVWCSERLGRHLSLDDVEQSTFYELLDVELGGATQTIAAAGASKADAELLELAPGVAGAVVRTGDRGRPRKTSAHERARLPVTPHAVRGGDDACRPLDGTERIAPGRVNSRLGLPTWRHAVVAPHLEHGDLGVLDAVPRHARGRRRRARP